MKSPWLRSRGPEPPGLCLGLLAVGAVVASACASKPPLAAPAGPRITGVIGTGALQVPPGTPTQVALLGGFEGCGGGGLNVREKVRGFFGSLASGLGLSTTMYEAPGIVIDDLAKPFAHPAAGSLLAVYAGHAQVRRLAPATPGAQQVATSFTSLCLAPTEIGAQDLLEKIGSGPAVIVLGACQSAYVDVSRRSAMAVISASPRAIGADPPAFLQLVAEAVGSKDLDANCDGLVTDFELFTYVTDEVRRRDPQGQQRPIPKLRRQADIQLPILRRWPPREGCPDLGKIEALLDRAGALGAAIRRQLAFARGEAALSFEATHRDHLFVTFVRSSTPMLERRIRAVVADHAGSAGLELLPDTITSDDGRRLAKLNIAGEVYELRVAPIAPPPGAASSPLGLDGMIVELIRSREQRLIAVRYLQDVGALERSVGGLLPRRWFTRVIDNPDGSKTIAVRVIGRVPEILDVPGYRLEDAREAVPCAEEEGQCFVIKARPVAASAAP